MSDQPRVEITLLGQTLSLRSDADAKYLRSLAASVEERVTALQRAGVRDPFKALMLAALEITDELNRARDEQAKDSDDVTARLAALVDQLNRAMSESPRRS
jgi:cell division protein ZapA (FtsZ GTPase activity inhibitor)